MAEKEETMKERTRFEPLPNGFQIVVEKRYSDAGQWHLSAHSSFTIGDSGFVEIYGADSGGYDVCIIPLDLAQMATLMHMVEDLFASSVRREAKTNGE